MRIVDPFNHMLSRQLGNIRLCPVTSSIPKLLMVFQHRKGGKVICCEGNGIILKHSTQIFQRAAIYIIDTRKICIELSKLFLSQRQGNRNSTFKLMDSCFFAAC
ncbi:hypothetical protein D3C75_524860 [compost metagenome]